MSTQHKLDSTKYWNQAVANENEQFRKAQSRQSLNSFKLFLVAAAIIMLVTSWKTWMPAVSQWSTF